MLNVPIPKVLMNVGANLVTKEMASTASVSKTLYRAMPSEILFSASGKI